ncbi:MAG: Ppx/GppA phosphatase family protein, partial [Hyphomicrobiales bacterium]
MARAGRFEVDATKLTSGARGPSASEPGKKQAAEVGRHGDDAAGETAGAARQRAEQRPFGNAGQPCKLADADAFDQKPNPTRKRRRRRRGRRSQRKNRNIYPSYGALDLGTNNCRLLVAQPSQSGFKVIDAFSRIVRLGEGVSKTGRLSPEAMDRCIGALRVCASKLKWRGVKRSRLIATEACRVTENGQEFIDRVVEETGLELEIIDRETEARLAFAGSAALISPKCENALVFDIGGGSTELMWVRCSSEGQE